MGIREEHDARRKKRCRYFNGLQNGKCDGGVSYPGQMQECACWGEDGPVCEKYSVFTNEELAQKEADMQRHIDLMRQGLSSCCEAPFNTSRVITSGQFKNHGPRFCSKCKRLCFMI